MSKALREYVMAEDIDLFITREFRNPDRIGAENGIEQTS